MTEPGCVRPKLPINGLGLAGFIVGAPALLVAWVPFFGQMAMPPAFVGGVLSTVGLIQVVTTRRTAPGWALAGLAVNVLAFATVMLMTVAFHIPLGAKFDRADGEVAFQISVENGVR